MQSDEIVLMQARRLCSDACFAVALQHRRLRSHEPEDNNYIFRWWADLQFLIVALRRIRRCAQVAERIPQFSSAVKAAVHKFDRSLPGLVTMRNVGEHVDAYAIDDPNRHNTSVDHSKLQVGYFDGTVYSWLGDELNIDDGLDAAEELFSDIKKLEPVAP